MGFRKYFGFTVLAKRPRVTGIGGTVLFISDPLTFPILFSFHTIGCVSSVLAEIALGFIFKGLDDLQTTRTFLFWACKPPRALIPDGPMCQLEMGGKIRIW